VQDTEVSPTHHFADLEVVGVAGSAATPTTSRSARAQPSKERAAIHSRRLDAPLDPPASDPDPHDDAGNRLDRAVNRRLDDPIRSPSIWCHDRRDPTSPGVGHLEEHLSRGLRGGYGDAPVSRPACRAPASRPRVLRRPHILADAASDCWMPSTQTPSVRGASRPREGAAGRHRPSLLAGSSRGPDPGLGDSVHECDAHSGRLSPDASSILGRRLCGLGAEPAIDQCG
jgi:hypothetical protein